MRSFFDTAYLRSSHKFLNVQGRAIPMTAIGVRFSGVVGKYWGPFLLTCRHLFGFVYHP